MEEPLTHIFPDKTDVVILIKDVIKGKDGQP